MSADGENSVIVVSGNDWGPPARSQGLHVWSRSEPCAAAWRGAEGCGCHLSPASGPEESNTVVWAGYRRTGRAVYRRVTAAIMMGAGTRAMGASEGSWCARRVTRAWHARGPYRSADAESRGGTGEAVHRGVS